LGIGPFLARTSERLAIAGGISGEAVVQILRVSPMPLRRAVHLAALIVLAGGGFGSRLW
jgi:hypothetical protein